MNSALRRRDFLTTSAALGAGLLVAGRVQSAPYKTELRKALIGSPRQSTLEQWKAAGFEGIESGDSNVSPEAAAKARKVAEKAGMPIHCLLRGWMNFNSPKEAQVEADIATVTKALTAAAAYGAGAILLVPCRIGGMPIPAAHEFDIEFDPKTGHVKQVVKGDNSQYQAYIDAHNQSTDATKAAVAKLIPVAEKCKVVIALENVWNNLWVKPALAKNLVESFANPWVQFYFDIGNHVKYAPSEEWIRTMGKLVSRCHVKDFKINRAEKAGGKFVDIHDGDVNWPEVRKALDEVGYNGWMTIEGSGALSLEERSRRLDLIFAGK
jgi:L-ribulose-5-phosphate 3-epimerase